MMQGQTITQTQKAGVRLAKAAVIVLAVLLSLWPGVPVKAADLQTISTEKGDACTKPPKCSEKSAEDLRYERILAALKKMEGGKEEYSKTATPANEPASYGKSQMLIVNILPGLRDKGGASFTYTYPDDGKSYTITHADISAAITRGDALYLFSGNAYLMGEANKHNDYKDLTIPARTAKTNGYLTQSGIAAAEWDTWWARAVAYQKLAALIKALWAKAPSTIKIGGKTVKVYTIKKNAKGEDVKEFNLTAFYAYVDNVASNIPGTIPAVSYKTRLDELLALAFPHVAVDARRTSFNPYVRSSRWREGYSSFYARAAYSHSTIPYKAFKYGIAEWYKVTPAVEEEFIRKETNEVITSKKLDKLILYEDASERDIAKDTARKHNGSGPAADTYANKFIIEWDKLSWSFTCKDAKGKTVDPRSLFPNSRYAGPEQGKTKALRLDGKN